jgi:predicted secreted protein
MSSAIRHLVSRFRTRVMTCAMTWAILAITVSGSVVVQADELPKTLATIEVSTTREVLQDQVRAILSARATGKTAGQVNQSLTEQFAQAREGLPVESDVEISSGRFSTYPAYDKEGNVDGWSGHAALVISSTNLQGAANAIDYLGKRLAIESIGFSLSQKTRREQERLLLRELGQDFKEKARMTAEAFGFKLVRVVNLDFAGGFSAQPRSQIMRLNAAPIATAGPNVSLEPATTTVSISVTGQIQMQ